MSNQRLIAFAVLLNATLSGATLKITTSEWHDARIPAVTLVIESEVEVRPTIAAMTDQAGMVELDLPAGIYSITATSNEFGVHRRSAVRLREGDDKTIYMHPIFTSPVGHVLCIGPTEDCRIKHKTVKRFSRIWHSRTSVGPAILYFESEQGKDGLRFTGAPVTFTWDQYAFYATQILCDEQRKICRGDGDASIELGSPRKPVDRFEIDLEKQAVAYWENAQRHETDLRGMNTQELDF